MTKITNHSLLTIHPARAGRPSKIPAGRPSKIPAGRPSKKYGGQALQKIRRAGPPKNTAGRQ